MHEMQIVANGNDAMATTARVTFRCTIKNGTTALNVESKVAAEVAWDKELEATFRKIVEFSLRHLGIAPTGDAAKAAEEIEAEHAGTTPILD